MLFRKSSFHIFDKIPEGELVRSGLTGIPLLSCRLVAE